MNRKKTDTTLFVVLVVLLLAFPSFLSACPSRISGMNLDADTYWMIGIDEVLFDLNPAILAELRPQVWGGNITQIEGGLIFGLTDTMNLYILSGLPLTIPFAVDLGEDQEQVRLGASLVAEKMKFGVSLMYTGMSQTDDTVGLEFSDKVIDLGAGAIIVLGESMDLDVAVDFTKWMIYREPIDGNVTYEASTFDASALGRLNWALVENSIFHIYGAFGLDNRSTETPDVSNKITVINAGFSDEINFGEKVMAFAGGLFVMAIDTTDGDDETTMTVIGSAGFEAALAKAITARIGIEQLFWQQIKDSAAETTDNTAPDTTLACGLGLTFGNFILDFELNDDLLLDGPNFISGFNNVLSFNLTATYYFGASNEKPE